MHANDVKRDSAVAAPLKRAQKIRQASEPQDHGQRCDASGTQKKSYGPQRGPGSCSERKAFRCHVGSLHDVTDVLATAEDEAFP